MASILSVGDIQGLAQNSNVVTVPSGHTLDVSSGTFVPSVGQVVQEEFYSGNDTFVATGASWSASPVAGSITPKFSNSLIVVSAVVAVWRTDGNTYFGVKAVNSGGNTTTPALWNDGYNYTGGHISWNFPFDFKYIAGSTSSITSTFHVYPNGSSVYFPNNSPINSPDLRWSVRITEIKQ